MMSRISFMTWGLLLVLIGVQLNLVESFVLTRSATDYWNNKLTGYEFETVPDNYVATSNGYFKDSSLSKVNTRFAGKNFNTQTNNPYSTPSYQRSRATGVPVFQSAFSTPAVAGANSGAQKMVTPPSWFCWPPIFLGSVLFLFGAAGRD